MAIRRVLLAGVLGLALATSACSSKTPTSGPTATGSGGGAGSVSATLTDFALALSGSAAAGSVTFVIDNKGPSEHEFVVLKTDLAPDKLPLTTENGEEKATEDGSGIVHVGESEDITAGSTTTLTLDLAAGNYVMICNLPAHYGLGMRAAFTVGS